VTLDTNVLNDTKGEHLQALARGLPIDFQQLTVTEREHEAWQGANFTAPFPSIPETGIFGEAQFGRAVFAAAGGRLATSYRGVLPTFDDPASAFPER